MQLALRDLCATRAGDKGDTSDIALFAYDRVVYDVLVEQVTADVVREHFSSLVRGEVQRYEVPNVLALKFVLHSALGGGGPRSLRSDNLGKTLGGALLRITVRVPADFEQFRRPHAPMTARWSPVEII